MYPLFLSLVFLGSLSNNAHGQSFKYNPLVISASEVKNLIINGDHLYLNIRGSASVNEFKIEVIKKMTPETDKEFFEDWHFAYAKDGEGLKLSVKGPADKSRLQMAYRNEGRHLPQFQINVTGPSRVVNIYSRLGNTVLTNWEENVNIVNHAGRVNLTGLKAQTRVLLMNGDFSINNSKGGLFFESYSANSIISNFEGKIKTETFSGSHKIESNKGSIDWSQQAGKLSFLNSKTQLDFRVGSANVQIEKVEGDVRGQITSGSLKVNISSNINLRVNSVDGPVNITAQQSSASINVGSKKGEIYGPSYLKTQQWSNLKTMTGKLRGAHGGGSIFVRSDNANIRIR